LKTPSAQESGYKIKFNEELKEGENYKVIIDFNVDKSIVKNPNKYILKPVVQAHLEDAMVELSGMVDPINSAYHIKVFNDTDEFATIIDKETGEFLLRVIIGTYDILVSANEGYLDVLFENIEITEDFRLPLITPDEEVPEDPEIPE
jgi:hypothetical protein